MTYQKQPLKPRECAHCGDPYQAVDRRRLYCCPSCKTLASNARRIRANAGQTLQASPTATPETPLTEPVAAVTPGPASLPFDLKTVGVVAAGSALGTYSVRALDKLLSSPTPAPARPTVSVAPVPIDPASWFPATLLAAPAASVLIAHPQWRQAQVCLQLDYFGRRFYYQPALRCLLWECGPGILWQLNQQAEFTRVFDLSRPQLAPSGAPVQFQILN